MSGDHYQANCPKQKKKEDQNRSITPYPNRNRSSSRDRTGASQGNETFRMLQGSFGTEPWSKAGGRAVAESTAAAGAGSAPAPAPVAGSAQLAADTPPTTAPEEEGSEEDEDLENDERARLEEEQMVWDETVKAMMEGYEEGSNYRLKFNIWKTEQDWKISEGA